MRLALRVLAQVVGLELLELQTGEMVAVAVLLTRRRAALVGLALLFFVIQMLILPQHQQPGRQLLQ